MHRGKLSTQPYIFVLNTANAEVLQNPKERYIAKRKVYSQKKAKISSMKVVGQRAAGMHCICEEVQSAVQVKGKQVNVLYPRCDAVCWHGSELGTK